MRFRQTTVAVSIILLFTSALFAFPSILMSIPNVEGASRSIFLDGRLSGWNSTTNPNPSISVVNGDTVTLSLSSGDGAPHLFYIDINGNTNDDCPQEKCSAVFPPDTSLPFAVDFAPGTYEYVCSIHPTSMRGSFVVQGFTITSSPSSLRVIQGSSNTSTIRVTSVNNFAGVVGLSTTVSSGGPTADVNPTSVTLSAGGSQTSTLTVNATSTATGSFTVNVTGTSGSATATRTVATLVVPPDFGISADPTGLVIPLDSTRNSTIILNSLDSFSGSVTLSTSPPAGITATLTRNSVILSSGGTNTSRLDVYVPPATTPGTYTVNVTGTSGSLAHNTTITVVAGPDFGISAGPAALTLTPGSSDSSTITLTSFNDFAGIVNLTGTVSPDGLTFALSPPSIMFSGSGTTPSVLAVNAAGTTAARNFTITITATNGLIVHSTNVTVSVRDFSVTVSNVNLMVQQGSSITTTVSIASLNRFAGVVNLTTTASSTALSRLLNVTILSLSPLGTGFAVLTLNASSVTAGTYTVSITGTSGSLVRTVSLGITVQPAPGEASILPLIGGVAVSAVAIAAAGLYFTKRRRLREKTPDSQIPT